MARRHELDALASNDGEDLPLSNECSVCRSDANLWICLICGNVGCGRYDAAHAFQHYEASGHSFTMDMDTQRVWDYASDGYVHRIVQNKADGKLVQLDPGSIVYEPTDEDDPASNQYANGNSGNGDDFDDYVPRSKLTDVGLEYTHLLTSQLDSQRTYFESLLDSAADKASLASTSAAKAEAITSSAQKELETLRIDHDNLIQHAIPNLKKNSRAHNAVATNSKAWHGNWRRNGGKKKLWGKV